MKALAFMLVMATPAFADVAVPQPPAKTWRDSCAARIDETAKKLGLPTGAKTTMLPLLHEDGKPNSLQYVEYATPNLKVSAGDDAEAHPDQRWTSADTLDDGVVWFRRFHNRFAKIEGIGTKFRGALDECLKMGDLK